MKSFNVFVGEKVQFDLEFEWGNNEPDYDNKEFLSGINAWTTAFKLSIDGAVLVEISYPNRETEMISSVVFYLKENNGSWNLLKQYGSENLVMSVQEIISKIIVLCKKLAETENMQGFGFSGIQENQSHLYDTLFSNEKVIKQIEEHGFYIVRGNYGAFRIMKR